MNLTKSTLNSSGYTHKLLGLTLAASLLLTVWASSSHLWDKYRVVMDVQDYYWMALAQDPTLFARDYIYLPTSQILQFNIWGFGCYFILFMWGPGCFIILPARYVIIFGLQSYLCWYWYRSACSIYLNLASS